MAWRCSGNTLAELVQNLCASSIIKSAIVKHAMLKTDRKLYCSHKDHAAAYMDTPLSIGYGVTISAPHMHAHCLELLQDFLKPGMKALDVGSGSGYLVACMAQMVCTEKQGQVYGIEYIPQVFEQSIKNLQSDVEVKHLLNEQVFVKEGDGWAGWKEHAPYNAIHVGAAAKSVPQQLLDQLASPGRMVIPVGTHTQMLQVVDKDAQGKVTIYDAFGVQYVPLVNPSHIK